MTSIKITCDPYKNEITFSKMVDDDWVIINSKMSGEENSRLLEKRISKGFMPFIVRDIVDIIDKDYGNDTEIVYEGPEEFYYDLKEICNLYSGITLNKSTRFLNNASEILNESRNIYNDAVKLVKNSEFIKLTDDTNQNKYLEATNDIIPLCVIGNYSSGKSTFINSLIGSDILPSGDDPVTASVYKIAKSEYNSVSKIRFNIDNHQSELIFDGNSYNLKSDNRDNPIISSIENDLSLMEKEPVYKKINKVLEILNKNSTDVLNLEIEVPFKNGLLQNSTSKFLIFDTPGSDTTTYSEHIDVLKTELEQLTNGLIIFIVDRLDSEGNEKLYEMLKNIKELDSRFTMIVVTKADNANLPESGSFTEEEISKKMEMSVPRNLYSNGIYFVSSILGLGAKNDGEFINSHNSEFYETNKDKYSNPENKYYKKLYNYDIMPRQLKNKMIEDANNYENKIFVNSGLYAIEHEILTFANNYSSYNKCYQSKMFLENFINEIKSNIVEIKKDKEEKERLLRDEMDQKKKALCEEIDKKRKEYNDCYDEDYKNKIGKLVEKIKEDNIYSEAKMKEKEDNIKERFVKELGLQEQIDEGKESIAKANENLKDNLDTKNILGIFKSLGDIGVQSGKNFIDESKLKDEISTKTSGELFGLVCNEFIEKMKKSLIDIYNNSKEFYDDKSENQVKKELLEIVNCTDALQLEQKEILKNVIVEYEEIEYDKKSNEIFDEKEIKNGFLIFKSKLNNSKKLTRNYNRKFAEDVDSKSKDISNSHKESFNVWTYKLVESLKENIIKFNPELMSRQKEINEEKEKIKVLEKHQKDIEYHLESLKKLIDWDYHNVD